MSAPVTDPTASAPARADAHGAAGPEGPWPDGAAQPAGGPGPARPRRAGWWRRHRLAVVVVVAFLLLTVLAWALSARTSARPLAPDNPAPDGARAAAQLLSDQGVRVQEATTLAEVGTLAGPGSTVLITDPSLLLDDQRTALLSTGADLVVVGATFSNLDAFDGDVTPGGAGSAEPVTARCADPDAAAAGEISFSRGSVSADPGSAAVVCFPVGDNGAGAYAVWERGEQTVRYLADARLLSNAHLAEDGNAALTLRALGHHPDLVWYLPSPLDLGTSVDEPVPALPVRLQLVLAALAAAAVLLALAHGRALGPVVTEVMPVVVRAAETTRGRGRLYRRSRAHGHAAAALRAGTAARLARALGLAHSAGADTLLDALTRATGHPAELLRALLYGPPPTDDAGLLALTAALDTLESEVHRS
ncbi:DUF4350 domain-containing protein [Georgenia yuyongxinii]|uniref:DUF4350 domain-containing protein n=1 Tax=Georgenia yuyongxinii TaxID=2589797 RepID=UPI00362B8D57